MSALRPLESCVPGGAGRSAILPLGLRKLARLACVLASEHTGMGLTQTLEVESGQYELRMNCIRPGTVDTVLARAG